MIREKLVPIAWLMTAAVIIGTSVGFAARADAMPPEDAYIATLDHFGVPYGNAGAVITVGYAVCVDLDNGVSIETEVRTGQLAGGFSRSDAETIVGAAVGALCPRHSSLISAPRPVAA